MNSPDFFRPGWVAPKNTSVSVDDLRVRICMMDRTDIQRVLEIEEEAFPLFPWTKDEFDRMLLDETVQSAVAIESAEIIGYLIYDFRKEIEKAADYIELLNIAVDIGHRGKHVGSKMVEFLVDRCKSYPDSLIALSVRVGNEQARGFFEKNGFEETEEEPDKFGSLSNENAVRVERIV